LAFATFFAAGFATLDFLDSNVIVVNFLVDIAYAIVDPRLRRGR
jgi:ABC-type dipeptide/oligopeptide/nickel transport system permease component